MKLKLTGKYSDVPAELSVWTRCAFEGLWAAVTVRLTVRGLSGGGHPLRTPAFVVFVIHKWIQFWIFKKKAIRGTPPLPTFSAPL